MKATERLYLSADRRTVVREGDKRAALLLAAKGQEIDPVIARQYGEQIEQALSGGSGKRGRKPANKMAGRPEDKAAGAAEDKEEDPSPRIWPAETTRS